MTATNKETEKWIKDYYEQYGKYMLLKTEYDFWLSDTKIEINDKARESFDFNEYWDSIFKQK